MYLLEYAKITKHLNRSVGYSVHIQFKIIKLMGEVYKNDKKVFKFIDGIYNRSFNEFCSIGCYNHRFCKSKW